MSSGYSPTRADMRALNSGARVLAVDPGYDRLGIAVLEGNPSFPTLIMSQCVEPPPGPGETRLALVSRAVSDAITEYRPTVLGLETLFFSINKKTALKVAEARGAVLAVAGLASLPVFECSPQEVKIAVTGHGAASKAAVASFVAKLVSLPPKKRRDDEIDAIAIGIATLASLPRTTPQITHLHAR